MSTSTLDRVMGQAEDAANNFREPSTNRELVAQTGGAVAQRGNSSAPSLAGIQEAGGISVDQYLQLKFEGFTVNEPAGIFDDDIKATIDMSEVVPITQIRSTRNGQTEFYKSYNGFSTPSGESFAQVEARLRATPDTVVTGPYQTAEIPFTVLADVTVPGKTGGVIPAGQRIGTTPPLTGVKFFSAFLKALSAAGISQDTGVVEVVLKHSPQKNNKGNKWGVVDFRLVGEADVAE